MFTIHRSAKLLHSSILHTAVRSLVKIEGYDDSGEIFYLGLRVEYIYVSSFCRNSGPFGLCSWPLQPFAYQTADMVWRNSLSESNNVTMYWSLDLPN